MNRKKISTNYIYNLMFQIINLLLPIITTPYISRILQADNIGIYSYTYSVVTTFVLFGSLGTATYGQKEIAAAGDDKKLVSKTFLEINTVKLIAMGLALIVYMCMSLLSTTNRIYYLVQIPYLISAALDISWFYQGIEDFKYVSIRSSAIKIISTVFIFLLVRNHDDLILYLLIMCLSQLVGNIPMWTRLSHEVICVKIKISDLKRHLRPTLVYFVPSIATQVYAVLDKVMLGMIVASNAENGYYEQAHKIINMTMTIVTSYTVVMRSRMSYLFVQNKIDEIKSKLIESLQFVCFLIFPMGFGMGGIAENFVPWFFGEGFTKVTVIIYAFCPLYFFLGICTCIGTHILTPGGWQSKSNIGQVLGAIANLILNAILIPKFLSVGAAIASTSTELLIMIVYLYYSKEFIRWRDICRISMKYFIASIVMFIPLFIISRKLPSSIINTMILVGIGAAIYIVMLFVIRASITDNIKVVIRSKLERSLQE